MRNHLSLAQVALPSDERYHFHPLQCQPPGAGMPGKRAGRGAMPLASHDLAPRSANDAQNS